MGLRGSSYSSDRILITLTTTWPWRGRTGVSKRNKTQNKKLRLNHYALSEYSCRLTDVDCVDFADSATGVVSTATTRAALKTAASGSSPIPALTTPAAPRSAPSPKSAKAKVQAAGLNDPAVLRASNGDANHVGPRSPTRGIFPFQSEAAAPPPTLPREPTAHKRGRASASASRASPMPASRVDGVLIFTKVMEPR